MGHARAALVRSVAVAFAEPLVGLVALACSKSDSGSSSGDPGGDAAVEARADAAPDAPVDAGADTGACLPPGESCQASGCCAPAACSQPSGGIGTCCLPLGARCTVAGDCCVQPGLGNTTCSPGDGGLVCTFQTL